MKPERLQEIKVVYTLPYGEEYPTAAAHDLGMDIAELIAAVEQAQAELEKRNELLEDNALAYKAQIDNLHAQLAEAQAELAEAYKNAELGHNLWRTESKQGLEKENTIATLRKQLAEAQDSRDEAIRREADQFAKDRDKLAASQAEVERLSRTMIVIDNDNK